ncbi:MAG: hypothetical protein CH104c_0340 [Candidatus Woesebacteria bacterium]|nr:MAG: hypothetical protein CH104c_0340 [Candidatus Woesebacteria bacterium]
MSEVPRYWRLREQLLRLEGSNCQSCKIVHFPPREVCPDCGFKANGNNKKDVFEKPKKAIPQDQQ